MGAVAWLMLAISLHGCGQPERGSSASRQEDGDGLEGEWQLAELDGRTTVGVALTGTKATLAWQPTCAGWSIDYRQAGQAVKFTARHRPKGELTVVCAIGYPGKVPALFRILPGLTRITASDKGSIRLSGGGHAVLLERPVPAERLAVRSLAGRWTVSDLDGEPLGTGSPAFTASDNDIHWSPYCAGQWRSYHIENGRIAVYPPAPNVPPTLPPLPPGTATAAPPPVCVLPVHPRLDGVFAAMEAATHVRPGRDGEIMLVGGGRSLTLKPSR